MVLTKVALTSINGINKNCGTGLVKNQTELKTKLMKKSILFFALLIASVITSYAQATYNLVIFSEDAEPFYAYVNGIRQNDKPETNIRITDLNSQALNIRIQFENKALPQLKQNMMPEPGFEHTVNIKMNMKKELKMRYFGKVPLDQAPKSSAATVQYHTAEDAASAANSGTSNNTTDSDNNTTITTTSTEVNSNPENVTINVNMGGVGMNVNVNGMDNNNAAYSSSSSTTITSSTTTSGNDKPKNPSPGSDASIQPVNAGGCNGAMNATSYDKMKQSIMSKPFSDTKMSTAKVATKNSCLSAAQIQGICALFSMDDDRLEYAKYAYNFCVDKANYYQVSEAFSFSSTTDDLNKFLEEK